MKSLIVVSLFATLSTVAAQAPRFPLGRTQTVSSTPGISLPSGGKFGIGASREIKLAAGGGTEHSGKVVIAAYVEDNGGGVFQLAARRSVDGGRTWGAPQILYTLGASESLDSTPVQVEMTGHTAFVLFGVGVVTARTSGHNVLLFGSQDQGQTWTGAFQVNDGSSTPNDPQYDIDEAYMVARSGICHIVWEADYAASTLEDAFYASVTMAAGAVARLTPETRISNTVPPGTTDVDDLDIDADGGSVLVAYRSDQNGQNDVYSRLSVAAGTDIGTVPETNHTNYVGAIGVDKAFVAISGSNAYVSWPTDIANLPFNDDDIEIAVSNDSGATWNNAIVYAAGGINGFDADGPQIVASGNRVVVAWQDERNNLAPTPNQNYSNDVFVRVDNSAGAGLLAGTAPETLINTLSPPTSSSVASGATLFEMKMVGDTIAVAIEDSWNNLTTRNGEDAVLCKSTDGGATWSSVYISGIGSAFAPAGTEGDIDDPRLALTTNQDCAFLYASEPLLGGGGPNEITASGIRLPYVVDDTGTGGGLTLRCGDTSVHGDPALMLITASGAGVSFPLAPARGLCLNITFDAFTSAALGAIQLFGSQFDNQGNAPFPLIPDLTTLLGVQIDYQAIGFDFAAGGWAFVTDPGTF